MTHTVRVNFSRPMPLFPLPGTVLLPHAVQPLHIFEPRYRQMVEDCLDKSGQIATASFGADDWHECSLPALRPAVCVGQIIKHEKLPNGQHYIILHGVCRARIRQMLEPDDRRLYRMARLAPLETVDQAPPPLEEVRDELRGVLASPTLKRMRSVSTILEWFDHGDVPTHALLELIGFTLVQDPELRYRLLEEADALTRASLIRSEIDTLNRVLQLADRQSHHKWGKGQSWN